MLLCMHMLLWLGVSRRSCLLDYVVFSPLLLQRSAHSEEYAHGQGYSQASTLMNTGKGSEVSGTERNLCGIS